MSLLYLISLNLLWLRPMLLTLASGLCFNRMGTQ
jgi:hypothetical protein